MPSAVKRSRAYSTTLHREHADLTRQRVLAAARQLFVAHGYEAVTMQAIATEAGVAYQTVYAQFNGKLELALELCNSQLPHVGPTVGLLGSARDAGDPVAWAGMVGTFARRLYEPCAEVLRFMRESGDAQLLAQYRHIEANLLERLQDLGPQLERAGRLRPGLTAQKAVEIVWLLAGPETYERLVLDRGWSPDAFEAWLGQAVTELVTAKR